ncbi:MAG: hypothetical protein ABMA13_15100 [Chthoniobacteraceae bacterium]
MLDEQMPLPVGTAKRGFFRAVTFCGSRRPVRFRKQRAQRHIESGTARVGGDSRREQREPRIETYTE